MCEVAKITDNLAMKNKHLNQTQRVIISRLHERGLNQSQIAEIIDVSQSTVSRELSRNKGLSGYNPEEAEALARKRKSLKAVRKAKISGKLETSRSFALSRKCQYSFHPTFNGIFDKLPFVLVVTDQFFSALDVCLHPSLD